MAATPRGFVYGLDSSYTRLLGISGPMLRDSYHLGQTINNDYGRPYRERLQCIDGSFYDLRSGGRFRCMCGESINMLRRRRDTRRIWPSS